MTRRRAALALALFVPWSALLLLAPYAWRLVSWNPVTLDRNGNPEPLPVHYEIRVLTITPISWSPGPDGELQATYTRVFQYDQVTTTIWNIPDPCLGCVIAWWDPVTVDPSGNRSDAP